MLSNHTLVNLSQDETFLGRKSRMTLLISDKVVCNIVRTKVIEMFSHMQGGRKRLQHCKGSLVGQCQKHDGGCLVLTVIIYKVERT